MTERKYTNQAVQIIISNPVARESVSGYGGMCRRTGLSREVKGHLLQARKLDFLRSPSVTRQSPKRRARLESKPTRREIHGFASPLRSRFAIIGAIVAVRKIIAVEKPTADDLLNYVFDY